jgi:hypothetical protein
MRGAPVFPFLAFPGSGIQIMTRISETTQRAVAV